MRVPFQMPEPEGKKGKIKEGMRCSGKRRKKEKRRIRGKIQERMLGMKKTRKSPRKKKLGRRQVFAATSRNIIAANTELEEKGANSTTRKFAPDSKGVELDLSDV